MIRFKRGDLVGALAGMREHLPRSSTRTETERK
jgi:hypothetical protein